jgi:hypothetical protein
VVDPTEDFASFKVQKIGEICNKTETPKIVTSLSNLKSKIDIEPMKIKVRYKNANMGKIKLKFKRDKVNSFNYGSTKLGIKNSLFDNDNVSERMIRYRPEKE